MKENELKEYKMKVSSFRKLPNPNGMFESNKKKSAETVFIIVNVKDIPVDFPTDTNPREQNMKTKVATKIKEGLFSENLPFFILNRGLVLSALDVKYDANNSEVRIIIEDTSVHGVIDGGHTYKTLIQNRAELTNTEQFVKIEVLTGIEDIFEDVAAARNTSVQVQDKAIAELKNKFELIKAAIQTENFSENIAYKENEDKDIDITEIITLLYMFNLERHNTREKMAVSAYSSKQACVRDYTTMYDKYENKMEENPYYKMKNVMVDIFKLYELVETNMAKKYKEGSGGRYGSVKGVEVAKEGKKFSSKFYRTEIEHRSPKGFLYPLMGAFRALLEEKEGFYQWLVNPFDYFDELGGSLISETVERSRTLGNNPNAVGKDTNHWKQLYNNVLTQYLLNQMK